MKLVLLFLTLVGLVRAEESNVVEESLTTNKLFKVLRAVPEDLLQLNYLLDIYHDHTKGIKLDFWKAPSAMNTATDIMIQTDDFSTFADTLQRQNITNYVIIDDVAKLMEEREKISVFNKRLSASKRRDTAGSTINEEESYNFQAYGSYPKMQSWMRALSRKHPNLVRYVTIGKTHEGRNIDGLEIGGQNKSKRIFWIDGGIHAREWAASHTTLYFIHQLTSRYGRDPTITRYVDELTFLIIPNLNPDGYTFSRSVFSPSIRLWRKNRSKPSCYVDDWGRRRCCRGVDLNRNFDFHWSEAGSSDDPCSEIYQGTAPFSEPETAAIRNTIFSNEYRGRFDGFVTLHTYSQLLIHPYGHKKEAYPADINELYKVGKKAAQALKAVYGTNYVVGSGADTLYPASGGSEDWAKLKAKIKFVYLMELRPDEKNWDGFILKERELIPTATETWAGIKVIADAIIEYIHVNQISAKKKPLFISLKGRFYDIRDFAKKHPGGAKVLEKVAGSEVDKYMNGTERIMGVKHEHSDAAYHMLESYGVDKTHTTDPYLEKGRPIFWEIGHLGEKYWSWIHQPYDGTLRLFKSDFMEKLTRTSWYMIPGIWMPLVLLFAFMGFHQMIDRYGVQRGGIYSIALFALGSLVWTLLEYVLHKYAFHWEPNPKSHAQITFHFAMHGIHHKTPMDGDRLVFPPTPALFIIAFFYLVYTSILPWHVFCCFGAGKLFGYIAYDCIHYYLHHGQPAVKSNMHYRKVYHHNHHFKDFDVGFGISTNLWDYIFSTEGSGPL
uniref:Cytochrome b5 heme-binding domain-containing protein n=1 Tax=Rhabditophanes sp. KR3021 TaxID=114890 RepID=A0AC35UE72_9BILA